MLRGVVTFSRPTDLVIADGTAGVYVFLKADAHVENLGRSSDIRVGMRLEIRGTTAPGGFAPTIRASALRYLGIGELPPALPVAYGEFRSGQFDCQRVQVSGVVQRNSQIYSSDGEMRLEVAVPGGVLSVFLMESKGVQPDQFVDAEVHFTGVAFTFFTPRGEAIGAHLRVSNMGQIQILRPAAPDPFGVSEVSPLALRPFRPAGPNLHRQRLTGIVTLTQRGDFFYVEMQERSVRIHTRSTEPLAAGDIVEVSGFVDQTSDFGFMREAIYRRIGTADPPQPLEITRAGILRVPPGGAEGRLSIEDFDGRLVRLSARLVDMETKPEQERRLFLESDGGIIIATLDRMIPLTDLQHLTPGSTVEVTGVCSIKFNDHWPNLVLPVPKDFTLILPGPEAVRVLRRPSWWTPGRLLKLLAAVGSLLLITTGLIVWLRHQVAQRTAELAREMRIRQEQERARHDAEVEFHATLRERERLAADLHDSLAQTLTGVAMQLDATRRAPEPALAQRNLALASRMLSRSRDDIRRSVWNLRANELDGRLLREAIHHIAGTILDGTEIALRVGGSGDEYRLPDLIAGNLVMLAKEALTNALKHANPSQIDIAVDYDDSNVTFTFHDNGLGFDPASAPGPHQGHFGLTGMRERCSRIGGRFHLRSSPGTGTMIKIQVTKSTAGSLLGIAKATPTGE